MNRAAAALAMAAATLAVGCEDLRQFQGDWEGTISGDAAQRQGFAATARAAVTVRSASSTAVDLDVTLPGEPIPLTFAPVRSASADVLGDIQLAGQPLRTYVGFLEPAGAERLLVFVSLFAEGRIELRVIRGPADLYGVFRLRRR